MGMNRLRNSPRSRSSVERTSRAEPVWPRKERLEFQRRAGGTYWPLRALQPSANLEVPRAERISTLYVKILSRYVLREHVGPFLFALTALTSLMILNFISRQFGELVGKGLPSSVIGEFFLLSIPFTIALTLPMSVLVAVLYAFSRLAAA